MSRLSFRTLAAAVPLCLLSMTVPAAVAQFPGLHGASLSVGATSNFDETLTNNPTPGNYVIGQTGGGSLNTTVSNQQQFTTLGVGFLSSLQLHPRPWAGLVVNYGFQHYSERYTFNYTANTTSATQGVSVPTDTHELTAAYQFHPRFIPFQPFVNIGGGSIDFAPRVGSNQWRGAGLIETGFDIPASRHIGFRFGGRSLIYRAPNFATSALSTRTWRATVQPSVSTYYRF